MYGGLVDGGHEDKGRGFTMRSGGGGGGGLSRRAGWTCEVGIEGGSRVGNQKISGSQQEKNTKEEIRL